MANEPGHSPEAPARPFAVPCATLDHGAPLRWLPRGTHQYEKLVRPQEIERPLSASGMQILERKGVFFNPLQNQWNLSADIDVNYMMLASRPGQTA